MFQPARRLLTAVFAAMLSLACVSVAMPTHALAQSPATQAKYAAIVVDAHSGEVLYASRADSPRYPASITKVMTLYLTFEALEQGRLKASDPVVISPRAAAQPPTKLGLRPGEMITVDQAIRALTTKSANDIAVALAEKVGGTESRFAALMTLRAQELGMSETRFVNASGLPDSRQISSARDIALLSRAVMRDYPQYYSYFGQRYFDFRGQSLRNHNRLLHQMPGVDGLKTGFTNASGFNLAASAVRDGRRLIAVVLGGSTAVSRDNHVEELLTAGFEVMRRRAAGDTAQFAALLPAATQTRYALVGSVEQGSIDYVVPRARGAGDLSSIAEAAHAAPPERPTRVARAEPPRRRAPAAEPAPRRTGGWAVQVGAIKTSKDARARLNQVAKTHGRHFRKADAEIVEGAGAYGYRVRFEGFDAAGAKAACKALSGRGSPCMAMRAG